jgi:predicted amidohydrolase YtcJ
MDAARLVAVICAAALAGCAKERAPQPPAADLLIAGGAIYTGRADTPTVEAVAVKDGRVLAAGAEAELAALIGETTQRIDLQVAALYPGFVDSHAHLLGVGLREMTLNLEGTQSIEQLVAVAAAAASRAGPDETVYGRGWIETGWPEGRFPNRRDLDRASAKTPIVLERADGHALVANSAAIAKAGVTRATPDPAGGRIERDADGEPTGMFIDNAMRLIEPLVAAPSPAARREAYAKGAEVYAARGWTGLHNMSVDPADLALIEEQAAAGRIKIRVYNALDRSGYDMLVDGGPQTDRTGRIVTRAVKLYVDGALGSRGAALFAPYADAPSTAGLLLMSSEEAAALFDRALKDGVQIATHAIGDRGNRLVLNWYEAALRRTPPAARRVADPRWRIEHAQVLSRDDIPRFADLGIIASMQPSHAIGDLYFAPARLGDARLDGAYAWRSLIDAGAVIAGGSDAPVERGDPLIEFYAAVARKDLEGRSGPDWRPEQKTTRAEALAMFTAAPAFAAFAESEIGVIEPGKRADFTAFSKDIMTVPEAEILTAEPALTVVDGEIIFRAEGAR